MDCKPEGTTKQNTVEIRSNLFKLFFSVSVYLSKRRLSYSASRLDKGQIFVRQPRGAWLSYKNHKNLYFTGAKTAMCLSFLKIRD
jgi:hypothetical protein